MNSNAKIFAEHFYHSDAVPGASPGVLHMANTGWGGKEGVSSHRSVNWVLDYVLTGTGSFRVDALAELHPRPARSAHLYMPDTTYYEFSPEGARSCWMIFTGGELLQLDRVVPEEYCFLEILDPEGKLEQRIIDGVHAAIAAGEKGYLRANRTLYDIAILLENLRPGAYPWQKILGGPDDNAAVPSDWLKQARQLLLRHLDRPWSLADIARRMHCSKSSFSHKYRTLAGETPGETLKKARIKAAISLLDNNYSLKEIASMTGFCDEYHLSRSFKQITGQAPHHYRLLKNGNPDLRR